MSGCGYEIKELQQNLAPLPIVERGFGRHLYACQKSDRFIYTNGKTVVLRSFANPETATVFTQHKFNATVAQFSPNGEWVASGDAGGGVLVWGVKNGNIKNEASVSSMSIADLAWDGEGKRILAVGDGSQSYGRFFTWDTANACGTVEGHIKRIISCAVKKDRPFRAVTAGEDNSLVCYYNAPYKKDHILKNHERYPNKVQFSPNSDHLVSVGSDGKIFVYEAKELTKTREISDEKGHDGAIYSFCFNGNGTRFVTCGADKTCKIWDFEKGQVQGTYTIGNDIDDQQLGVIWHKDWIVSVSLSGALNYLDPANPGTVTKTVVGHMHGIKGLSVDIAHKKFYTGDSGGRLCMWENGLATWFKGKGHNKGLTDVAVNCDGSLVASVGLDDCLRFNETKSMEFSSCGIGVGGAPSCLCLGSKSPDLAVVGISQNKLTVIQGGHACTKEIKYKPLCCALSPDDSKVLVGGDDKQIHIYPLTGGALEDGTVVCKAHTHHVLSVRWSPCGTRFSSSSADKTVLVHDAISNAQLNSSSWEFHRMMVNDHAWSPDGKRVATISNDLNIFIWTDTEKFSTKKIKIQGTHSVSANKIDWLDNETLVSIGADGVIKTYTI